MSIKHTGLNKCPLHIYHSVAIAHNVISFSVHWSTSYGIMHIKLAISLLPWIINHSIMMKIYLYMSYGSNSCTGFTTRPLLATYWPFGLGAVSGGYTEGMVPGTSLTLPLRISRSWIQGMERTNLPDAVLTSTVLTTPSRPGNSCVITPSDHLNQGCWSSCRRTTEPSWRSHFP